MRWKDYSLQIKGLGLKRLKMKGKRSVKMILRKGACRMPFIYKHWKEPVVEISRTVPLFCMFQLVLHEMIRD